MMEVTGKKHRNLCKPCEKRKSSTYTDRSCLHCEEEMCQSCFDTHVQFKVSREHRLVKSFEVPLREETPTLDNCTKHLNEAIKFFCPEHNQVGCADCIIISHKNCKVEYILEHINEYKDSEESKIFKGDIDRYNIEAKQMLESIKRKKCHVTDVNNKFACAVRLFRDEMISHITHLADRMLKLGDDAMTVDMTTIENLEKESKSLVDETTKMRETLQSEADQPYRLFITAVSYKHNLHLVKEQLQRIEQTSRVTTYWFERDCHLEELVKSYKQLGSFQVVQKHHRGRTKNMTIV
ncbi:transcription intermediary factor 1-beta-like [Ruditapes philippinarum]|uniref:transcription intermediary factor 1-beta-like n=1 Tax=Ruditapes philippinarum TaxID=129788 RepID=UPI00295A85FA|nr:transcription intermediary factor 1-beta-like [Ruditapes philippinarum]